MESILDIPLRVPLNEIREARFYEQFREALIWLRGPKRSGKTATALKIIRCLFKYFGQFPVLNFHPYPAFGEYKYVGDNEFIELLKIAGDIIKEGLAKGLSDEVIWEQLDRIYGFPFRHSTWLFDEGYQNFRRMRAGSNLVLAHGDFIAGPGSHGQVTAIVCSPGDELTYRLTKDQVPIIFNCGYSRFTNLVCAKGYNPATGRGLKIWTDIAEVKDWYNTHNPVAVTQTKRSKIKLV